MRRRFAGAAAIVLGALWAAPGDAGPIEAARLPFDYRSVTVDGGSGSKSTLGQFRAPAVATAALGSSADLVLSTSGASSSLEPDGGESSSIAGATDLIAQLFARFAGDRVLLQGGVNLPSGKRELDEEELGVLQALGAPLLGFKLKNYGEGFDWSGALSVSVPAGSGARFGAGIGYIGRGAYTFVSGGEDYTPASEIALSAGADFGSAGSGGRPPVRLDATYRMYDNDELGSKEVFAEGDRLDLSGVARVPLGRLHGTLQARAAIQSDNEVLEEEGGVVQSFEEPAGTLTAGAAALAAPLSATVSLGLEAELSRFSGSDRPLVDGTLFGVGPSLGIALGRSTALRLRGLVLSGSFDEEAGVAEADISGYDIVAGLTWNGR